MVVSTTAADRPIVDVETFTRVQRARRNRLALILDIAIPRDFDPRIGDLEQVMLYNVDDLRAQAEQNRQRRQKGVDPAQAIIDREVAATLADLRHRTHAGAVLRQLGDYADAARLRELNTLFSASPTSPPPSATTSPTRCVGSRTSSSTTPAPRSASPLPTRRPRRPTRCFTPSGRCLVWPMGEKKRRDAGDYWLAVPAGEPSPPR